MFILLKLSWKLIMNQMNNVGFTNWAPNYTNNELCYNIRDDSFVINGHVITAQTILDLAKEYKVNLRELHKLIEKEVNK